METTFNVIDVDTNTISDRERLLANARLALLAGYIVKLGTRILALRARDENIDDGRETISTALSDGLYERLRVMNVDKDGAHDLPDRWMLAYDGPNLYRFLKSIIDDLDDYKVKYHLIGFVFAFATAPERDRARLHLGLPISDPPTTILS